MGLFLPKIKGENNVPVNLKSIIEYSSDDNEFGLIPMGSNYVGKQLLFLFLKFQIEHAQNLYTSQMKIDYFNYINHSNTWKNKLLIGDSKKILPKYFNKKTVKFFNGNPSIKTFSILCKKCNTENFFLKEDFANSIKLIEKVVKNNFTYQKLEDINKCYNCLEILENIQ